MNQAVRNYRKKLGRILCCGAATRTRLLEQFDCILSQFLEECPEPSLGDLYAAFGAPKQMAQELMLDVPQEERNRWKRRRRMKRAIPYVIIILLLAVCASIYAFRLRPVEMKERARVVIEEEEEEATESFEERMRVSE